MIWGSSVWARKILRFSPISRLGTTKLLSHYNHFYFKKSPANTHTVKSKRPFRCVYFRNIFNTYVKMLSGLRMEVIYTFAYRLLPPPHTELGDLLLFSVLKHTYITMGQWNYIYIYLITFNNIHKIPNFANLWM